MPLLISGSIAFDTIIHTVQTLRKHDLDIEKNLHISLFAPVVQREYGGTAGNIAYSLALLWKKSHIIASVWADSDEYIERLNSLGIHTELIHKVLSELSLQAYIVHDESDGQINIFHPGAMNHSGEISHGNMDFKIAIVAPDAPSGMKRRVRECSEAWIYTIFDPGQAMGWLSKDELLELTEKANITIMNEPESIQFREITGIDFIEKRTRTSNIAIVTLGENGAMVITDTWEKIIKWVKAEKIVDATGCGDAFRSGLLYGLSEGWEIEKWVQLANIIGSIKIGFIGWQNHILDKEKINILWKNNFGIKFFE
jgi:adenosine kinase